MTNKIKKRYNRVAKFYDILDKPMEMAVSKWREKLLSGAKGQVLEVGIGTGKNIPYYPENVELTGVDFSPKMVEIAQKKAKNKSNIQLLEMDAEDMDFSDNSFDTVITSCVFCSVPNPVNGLKEIRRVCKNEGKILMLEHVRSEKQVIGVLMDVFNFIPLHLYGANINRETYENLLKAGFSSQHITVRNLWHDIVKYIEINNLK
jgi:ubiquinone/menaquinone biosynthesis C-methylase UbiE